MDAPKDPRSSAFAFGGAALIAFGLWWLARAFLPADVLLLIDRSAGALTLIALGVVVILFSRRGAFAGARTGARLYRSRSDRKIAGVLGGLGAYLGIDPLVLRIAMLLLTLMGAGVLVLAYVVMWVAVPEEPLHQGPAQYPPAPPIPGA